MPHSTCIPPSIFHRVSHLRVCLTLCVFHYTPLRGRLYLTLCVSVCLSPCESHFVCIPLLCILISHFYIPLRVPLHAYPTLCIAHCLTPYASHAVCVPLLLNFLFGYTTPCAFHFMCVLLPCVPSPVGAPPRMWAKDSTSQSGYPSMCCVKGGWIIFFVQGAVPVT